MKTQKFKTTMRLGKDTGSMMNWLMSAGSPAPEVGKGMTELHWSDRTAYQVMEISKDGKRVTVRQCKSKRVDDLGMTDSGQIYDYSELHNTSNVLVFRYGSWYWERKTINYTKEYIKANCNKDGSILFNKDFYDDDNNLKLMEGITYTKTLYEKANVLFGVQEEYYDYSF
jgi:hypothetical protein